MIQKKKIKTPKNTHLDVFCLEKNELLLLPTITHKLTMNFKYRLKSIRIVGL